MSKKHAGTSETVYMELRERLLHLELPPGTALSEIETAVKYKISRTPVRDAFKLLEREGLLEIRPHIGTFVSLIDLNMISDILYTREILEQAVYRDLATSFDKSQEFGIRLLLQSQKKLLESGMYRGELSRAFIVSDNAFHEMLYDLAGKKNVMSFWLGISSHYERFRTFVNLEERIGLKQLYHEHEMILEYISNKDYENLADCISHHIYDGFNACIDVVPKYPEYFKQAN